MHAAFEALGQFLEVAQVNPIVFLGEEAGDTIIPPLNDVQGDARKLKSARVAFRYLAGLCFGSNATTEPHADQLGLVVCPCSCFQLRFRFPAGGRRRNIS